MNTSPGVPRFVLPGGPKHGAWNQNRAHPAPLSPGWDFGKLLNSCRCWFPCCEDGVALRIRQYHFCIFGEISSFQNRETPSYSGLNKSSSFLSPLSLVSGRASAGHSGTHCAPRDGILGSQHLHYHNSPPSTAGAREAALKHFMPYWRMVVFSHPVVSDSL